MTQSIPDGFSMGELEALHETARHEDDCRCEKCDNDEPLYDGKTSEEVCDIAHKHLDNASQECDDPIVHKVMAIMVIENMIQWHTKVGANQDNKRSTVAWLRDAGKFQAIANILTQVTVGPNDFTCDD